MGAKLLAGAGILALAAFAVWMFGNARFDAGRLAERSSWQSEVRAADLRVADLRVENERRQTAAAERYGERLAAIEPIILRATDKVTTYAQTDAGRAPCLSAERVLGIEQDAASLFPPAGGPASRGAGSVRPDADADPG